MRLYRRGGGDETALPPPQLTAQVVTLNNAEVSVDIDSGDAQIGPIQPTPHVSALSCARQSSKKSGAAANRKEAVGPEAKGQAQTPGRDQQPGEPGAENRGRENGHGRPCSATEKGEPNESHANVDIAL